ncbi:MAG: sigma-54 interaction domain-containing protein [Candidatus Nitrospinota bacterium M3_3B_026]
MTESKAPAAPRLDPGFFREVFESVGIGMFIHDENRAVLAFNRAAEQITGYARDEIIGRDCRSLFHPAVCDSSCGLCKAIEKEEASEGYETQMTRRDGASLWIRLNAFPLGSGGGRPLYLVMLTDVTRMHEIEEHVGHAHSFLGITGKSDAIRDTIQIVKNIAETDITVLIIGETGVGKELVASAIHHLSPRKKGPFIKVNCAVLPETLIESELFGHVRGAFTGATSDRIGRFEAASGGTILLDEIGEVSPAFQAKILRVLQEREIERVGEGRPRKVDVRVVAATNKDLLAETRVGRFREDLYYRLAGAEVRMPPLRERKEDIPLLISRFISEFNIKYGRRVEGVSQGLMKKMMSHDWPGNVRELYNMLESAYVMCKDRLLTASCLPPGRFSTVLAGEKRTPDEKGEQPVEKEAEKQTIQRALEENRYNTTATARALGIGRTTLWRRMKKYDLK